MSSSTLSFQKSEWLILTDVIVELDWVNAPSNRSSFKLSFLVFSSTDLFNPLLYWFLQIIAFMMSWTFLSTRNHYHQHCQITKKERREHKNKNKKRHIIIGINKQTGEQKQTKKHSPG